MKLIVKTLSGKQLEINVENDWTIAQVKKQIETDHKMEASSLKLIAYGKVLDKDENKVTDHGLKEGDNIVAMVQKKKPEPKPAQPKPAPVPAAEPSPAVNNPAPVNPPQPAPV